MVFIYVSIYLRIKAIDPCTEEGGRQRAARSGNPVGSEARCHSEQIFSI